MAQVNRFAGLLTLLIPVVFVSCRAEYDIGGSPDLQQKDQDKDRDPDKKEKEEPIVCDPFDSENIIPPEYGLRGNLYSDQSQDLLTYAQRAKTSSHYIRNDFKVADLELTGLNVAPRRFNSGFPTSNGGLLSVMVNENPVPLLQWFALDVYSTLVLNRDTDAPGLYQFASITDDGSTLSVKMDAQAAEYSDLVPNEDLHPQRLKVARSVLNFQTGTESFPMRWSYFQGPANHIAMMVFMRKVANANQLDDPKDGATANELFFDTTVYPQPSSLRRSIGAFYQEVGSL